MESRCQGCGKKVVFAEDDNGKTQILDAVAPVYHVSKDQTRCIRAEKGKFMVSHFSTCPKADQFSKSKKKKGG